MIYSFRFWASSRAKHSLFFCGQILTPCRSSLSHMVLEVPVKAEIFMFDSLMYPKGLLLCLAHSRFWLNFCCEVSSLILCRNLRFRTSQYVLIIVKSIYFHKQWPPKSILQGITEFTQLGFRDSPAWSVLCNCKGYTDASTWWEGILQTVILLRSYF